MSSSTVDSAAPATARRPFLQTPPGRVIAALASLRLTVVLFALSMVLVFVGTLAQMDAGVWTVVNKYFRSFAVWVPFQLFVKLGQVFFGIPKTVQIANSWGFPFPGGWTLGSLLLINLLAAHLTRFKLSWKRSGILVLHAGMILMLLGELVTGLFAVEARMTIAEGETVNFADQSRAVELTVTAAAG
jgi:cytochrome c biogenesis factor